jgi:hypothetical protein
MSKDKQTAQEGSLEDFTWDTAGSNDFFGVPGTALTNEEKATTMEEILKEVADEDEDEEDGVANLNEEGKGKDKNKDKKKAKAKKEDEEEEEEEEEKEPTFFTDEDDEEDSEEKEDKESTKDKKEKKDKIVKGEAKKKEPEAKQTDGQFFKTLASELKERGFFQTAEIPEDKEELTDDEFFELADQEVEGRVNETFEAFAEEMDDDGKAFIKFKKNGGRTSDFVSIYVDSPLPDFGDKEFDAKNETHRKVVLETYLTLVEKLDDEDLSDRLQWLKENGKDQVFAEKYYAKLADIDTKQKAALLAAQEAKAKEGEDKAKKFVKTISEALNKIDTVGKIKFTKDDKKKLGELITKPTVKIGKSKYIPSFQSKLGAILKADTPESINKLLLLAKLVESDFDIKDIVTKVETEVVDKVKSKLRDAKNGVKPSSSGQYEHKKSLSDFFE